MAKKPEPKAPQFPADTCGACSFCSIDGDGDALCWGNPPFLHDIDGTVEVIRTMVIGPTWPVCFYFKPKTQ